MLYTVIEKDVKSGKETKLFSTNDKFLADETIENNPMAYIKYDGKAMELISVPRATKTRSLSQIDTMHLRGFPNSMTAEERKEEYKKYNNG